MGATSVPEPDTKVGCVDPQEPVSVTSVTVPEPAEVETSAKQVRAQVVTFDVAGTDATETIPPADWAPSSATTSELKFFDIPPRPTEKDASAAWDQEWVTDYHGFEIAYPCAPVTDHSAQSNSPVWSGAFASSGGLTEAYGETTFKAGGPCGAQPDSYTNWVGIGGNGPMTNLVQNGFWSDHTGGLSYPFWEAISYIAHYDTHVVPITAAGVNLNDVFNISTTFNTDTQKVDYSWHDLSAGIPAFHMITGTTIGGHPTADFYTGATAEAVDERGTISGGWSTLRNFVTDSWTQVQVSIDGGSLVPLRSVASHDGFYMVSAGNYISKPTSGATADAFADTWYGCGVYNN